ncbi:MULTISPECIES: hypothetical protein [unclassified Mycobacterium]|uniref:hypothetical protein n=1 Tax=unclassified Mycobacterium TaxID=2642494 RepID=UPI0029C7BB5F|nr:MULTISPECIES: hypothetical protein [unclassified Mycobacterium]
MEADAQVVPGPFRSDDGTPVDFGDAVYAWARAGYDALVDVARQPDGHISYQDVADTVQIVTSIETPVLTADWIGKPLALVAEMCVRNGEPQLTALVVSEGTLDVGDGYAGTYAIAGQPLPKNLQRAAAETRVECYDHFSRREAAGWDRTKLTGRNPSPQSTVKVRKVVRAKPEPVAPKFCPQCNLQLLPSGRCGDCD